MQMHAKAYCHGHNCIRSAIIRLGTDMLIANILKQDKKLCNVAYIGETSSDRVDSVR